MLRVCLAYHVFELNDCEILTFSLCGFTSQPIYTSVYSVSHSIRLQVKRIERVRRSRQLNEKCIFGNFVWITHFNIHTRLIVHCKQYFFANVFLCQRIITWMKQYEVGSKSSIILVDIFSKNVNFSRTISYVLSYWLK